MRFNEQFKRLCLSISLLIALEGVTLGQYQGDFEFIFPIDSVATYPPEEMLANCGGPYADATAVAYFTVSEDASVVEIQLENAAPNMLYTAWLRLGPGGSPLTGAGSTALADPSFIEALGAVTPSGNLTAAALAAGLVGNDGSGSDSVANGFMTDANGDGTFMANLSFSLADGIYPFTDFDEDIADMPLGDSPFAIRLASHCVDGLGYGLVAGTREAWFDLPAIAVPEPRSTTSWAIALGMIIAVQRKRRR